MDRHAFGTTHIVQAQRAVCGDRGDEDVRRVMQPCDVVHLAVARDQLRHRRRCIQVRTTHVLSIEDVTTRIGIFSFHENIVSGVVALVLLLEFL